MAHIERQNEPAWEDSTQGVIHLMGNQSPFSLDKTKCSAESKATHALHLSDPYVMETGGPKSLLTFTYPADLIQSFSRLAQVLDIVVRNGLPII